MVTINHVYLFIAMVIGGVFIEGLATSFYYQLFKSVYKRHHFSLGRYIFLLLLPLIGILFLSQQIGFSILKIFAIFALVGTALEWLIGFSYEYIVGRKLWSYYRFSINGYTSLLSMPLWGLCGVLFWLIAKVLAN